MKFEDYYWHQFDVLNKDTRLARQFGQDVWDYKQAEIDEYKLVAETLDSLYVKEIAKNKELKKRIDEAMEILEYNEYIDSPLQALNILKGQNHD